MEKLKSFLTKHQTLIVSIGIIVLLIVASVKVYKEYLVTKLTEKFIWAMESTVQDEKPITGMERIKLTSTLMSYLSSKSLSQLISMKNTPDSAFLEAAMKN